MPRCTDYGAPLRYYRETVLPYEGDECIIWPYNRMASGYGTLWLNSKNNVVSRLLCEEQEGISPTPKHQAAHSCGNGTKGCVTKRHVRWATRVENEADKVLHGRSNRGSRHGMSKLTEADVLVIRSLQGNEPIREIAIRFNVGEATIYDIFARRTWSHV